MPAASRKRIAAAALGAAADSGVSDAQARPQHVIRRAYGVQYSDTKDPNKRRPATFTRESFGLLLKQRHEEAFEAHTSANKVVKVMVFRELHSDGEVHFFAGILCEYPYRCTTIGKALQDSDRVYISFSTSHQCFWTLVVYGSVPSIHKSLQEIDVNPWHSEGKTCREELADCPRGARKNDKDRVRNFLGLPQAKGDSGKGMSIDEFSELVRANQWREQEQVLRAARESREHSPALYEACFFKQRKL